MNSFRLKKNAPKQKKDKKQKKFDLKEFTKRNVAFIIGFIAIITVLASVAGIIITINKHNTMSTTSQSNVSSNTNTESTTEVIVQTTEKSTEQLTTEAETETQESTTITETKSQPTQASTKKATLAAEPITAGETEAITEVPTPAPTEAPTPTEALTVEATTAVATEPTTVALPKRIAFLGDSITVGYYSDVVYTEVCCSMLDASEYNYGISGTTIVSDNDLGFVDRYKKIHSGVDVIVVFGGANDYYNNSQLGSRGSSNKNTFYGALAILCSGLKSSYPNAKIIFMTPLPGEFDGMHNSSNNDVGYSIYDYVDAIKEVCSDYNCNVLNSFSGTIINNNNYDEYTVDGLHLNESGHTILGKYLANYIKSLYK